MLDEDAVTCDSFCITENLRAWMGELAMFLKVLMLCGVREVLEQN